ncbi:JMJD6, partial [Symbiodinium sp. KB8]
DFIAHFEAPNVPCVIDGICGEDDDGNQVKVKLKYFLRYLEHQKDDSPMYIFDSNFPDDEKAKDLMGDFTVPEYFSDDLFKLAKAWQDRKAGEDDEAIDFFNFHLPRALAAAEAEGVPLQYIDYVQQPGETMFVPGGWWHAVLNLDDTVAVTQNFCSRTNFPRVWLSTRVGRKRMARRWLPLLEKDWPAQAEVAHALNRRDGFSMQPRPEEVARAHARKQRAAARAARRAAAGTGAGSASDSTSSDSSDTSDSDSDIDIGTPGALAGGPPSPWGGHILPGVVQATGDMVMRLATPGQQQ